MNYEDVKVNISITVCEGKKLFFFLVCNQFLNFEAFQDYSFYEFPILTLSTLQVAMLRV